jgi:hypothetical protein
MTRHEGTSNNKAPLFNGINFAFSKVRMRTYIMDLGVDVWDVVETGYIKPIVLANKDGKLEFSFNTKAMNFILSDAGRSNLSPCRVSPPDLLLTEPSSSRPEELKGSSISLSEDLHPQKSIPRSPLYHREIR